MFLRPAPAFGQKGLVLWHQFGLVGRGRNEISDWPRGKKLSFMGLCVRRTNWPMQTKLTQWALPLEAGASESWWSAFHQHRVHPRLSIDFVELCMACTEKSMTTYHFLCPPDCCLHKRGFWNFAPFWKTNCLCWVAWASRASRASPRNLNNRVSHSIKAVHSSHTGC